MCLLYQFFSTVSTWCSYNSCDLSDFLQPMHSLSGSITWNALLYDHHNVCLLFQNNALTGNIVYCRNSRSQSCPFCRDNLKKTDPGDLWIYVEDEDVVDMETVSRENLRRLFMYINKLPLIVPDVIFSVYDSHIKWMARHSPYQGPQPSAQLLLIYSRSSQALWFPCLYSSSSKSFVVANLLFVL